MEPTKLEKLLISEVSGVDSPANQLDGWMVTKSASGSEPNIVARIKEALLGTPTGKDDLDMDRTELVEVLGENNEALAKAVAAAVAESIAPAEGEGTTEETEAKETEVSAEVTAETAEALGEAISKSIQDKLDTALQPYNDILEKVLDRLERAESAFGVAARKSIEGQEVGPDGEPVEKSTPDLADAISAAFKR